MGVLGGTAVDPPLGQIPFDITLIPQPERRSRFVFVGEAVEGLEADDVGLVGEHLQGSAGTDRLQLAVIPHEPHERTGIACDSGDGGQIGRGGHASLVDDDHIAGLDVETALAMFMEPLRHGHRRHSGGDFELLGGRCRDRHTPRSRSGAGDRLGGNTHSGGLPRTCRTNADGEHLVAGCDLLGQGNLARIEL